jgi:hypothetical protein
MVFKIWSKNKKGTTYVFQLFQSNIIINIHFIKIPPPHCM